MGPTTTDMLVYMARLTWTCLSNTPAALKNARFDLVLPTQEVVQQTLLQSGFTFAPGLLQVLQSQTPPTIAYFKGLSSPPTVKIWAVYFLVLERPQHRPKTYIGSSTETAYGVSTRFYQYNNGRNIPKYVQCALDDGYTISHKGLLGWIPIPPIAVVTRARFLIILVEAALSFHLWAMTSRDKSYGMPPTCPWPLDTIEYDGCCSHSPLYERIPGEIGDLTSEQVKQVEAIQSEKRLQQSRRDNSTRGPERIRLDSKRRREKALATNKFFCDVCNVKFGAGNQLRNHKRTQKHINNAADIIKTVRKPQVTERLSANVAARRYYCSDCDYAAKTQQKLNKHLGSKKHLNAVAK